METTTPTTRPFAIPARATPHPHPDGGVFHLLPMTQLQLNRIARRYVQFEYLLDRRGQTVFNQHGQPIPKFDKDDDAIIAEAIKHCEKITNIGIPLFIAGEQELEGEGDERKPVVVTVWVNDVDAECDDDHASLRGRCDTRVSKKGVTSVCAHIRVGDYTSNAAEVMNTILAGAYEFIQEQELEEQEPAAPAQSAEPVSVDALKPVPEPKKKKKVKVTQLVAEWVIETSAKDGTAKREAALGN